MTAPGISLQNMFHGGVSVEYERSSHGSYLLCLNLVGLKERCRGICVALQNRFRIHPETVDGTRKKKIRHYPLSSREWINVLYVTPRSEDPPLGLIDRQSRLSLGSTDIGGNIDRKVSAAEGIPDTLHACSWGLDVSRWI